MHRGSARVQFSDDDKPSRKHPDYATLDIPEHNECEIPLLTAHVGMLATISVILKGVSACAVTAIARHNSKIKKYREYKYMLIECRAKGSSLAWPVAQKGKRGEGRP
jgi:hypothetical protein